MVSRSHAGGCRADSAARAAWDGRVAITSVGKRAAHRPTHADDTTTPGRHRTESKRTTGRWEQRSIASSRFAQTKSRPGQHRADMHLPGTRATRPRLHAQAFVMRDVLSTANTAHYGQASARRTTKERFHPGSMASARTRHMHRARADRFKPLAIERIVNAETSMASAHWFISSRSAQRAQPPTLMDPCDCRHRAATRPEHLATRVRAGNFPAIRLATVPGVRVASPYLQRRCRPTA